MKRLMQIIFVFILSIIVLVSIINIMKSKGITIMIDPGHGGVEGNLKGAVTAIGGREVTLNNSLSRLIGDYLEKEGYTVLFTRDPSTEDEYISLGQRSKIANEENADLLVSIHHDAVVDKSVTGFSLYYSSYRANIDNEGVYLLYNNKEYTFIKEEIIAGRTNVFYKDGNATKKVISGKDHYKIIDKSPHEVVDQSKKLADILFEELETLEYLKPLHGAKEKAVIDNDLKITSSTNMPSILIEGGFVSNEEELRKISKKQNQKEFARKVVKAIDKYFSER